MYLCYHHNDMDGKGAGIEVYRYLTDKLHIQCTPSMFIMRGYDEPFSEDDYSNKVVFIVDLSFTQTSIEKLFAICEGASKVIWIDHHESSAKCLKDDEILERIKKYDNLSFFVNQTACGALLTNLYLNQEALDNSKFELEDCLDWKITHTERNRCTIEDPDGSESVYDIDFYLKLIDLWDRWAYGDDIKPVYFNFGVGMHNTSIFAYKDKEARYKTFNDTFWNAVRNVGYVKQVMGEGKIARNYFISQSIKKVKALSYEATINGYSALILNSDGNSLVFGSKIDLYDLVVLWSYNGKLKVFQYSLYSSENSPANCEQIARSFNPDGGGHVHAAGFSSKEFIKF